MLNQRPSQKIMKNIYTSDTLNVIENNLKTPPWLYASHSSHLPLFMTLTFKPGTTLQKI